MFFHFGGLLAALGATLASQAANYGVSVVIPPEPVREFRGAWVASVKNIDWPSQKTLSTQEQKAELLAILDRAAQLKLNAIIFQVRPACDALYASRIEPWSEYLTGTMGKPPEPFYDPLAYAVEEAHKRGLELHAWFNPYRARLLPAKSPPAPAHISQTRPQLVRQYGEFLWLDPGEKEVQDYSLSVVMDVVKRYDVDGIHFDDYFYPYKTRDSSGRDFDFPDDASWRRLGAGGKLSRDDWRRENVNLFIQRVYKSIRKSKPWVKFGVSPFGIWRPRNPPQIRGLDAYASLYADSRKWLVNGWVDYFAPQLYWNIESREQSYPVLLRLWAEQDVKGRHLWPGISTIRIGNSKTPSEIVNEIRLTRQCPPAAGNLHWSIKALAGNRGGIAEALSGGLYAHPALVPASPWLDRQVPGGPAFSASIASLDKLKLSWKATGGEAAWLWVVQRKHGTGWSTLILPGNRTALECVGALPTAVALTAVGRCGNASAPAVLSLQSGTRR